MGILKLLFHSRSLDSASVGTKKRNELVEGKEWKKFFF